MIAVENAPRARQVHRLGLGFVPRQRRDRLQIVAGDDELRGAGVHERELLHFLGYALRRFPCQVEAPERLQQPLMLIRLGVDRHAQLGLDRLELFPEKVLPLALFDLLIELALDLLLDAQQFLLFLDEHQHAFHARLDVHGFEHRLLLGSVDIQDRSHEVRDFARVVDVDHVEAHFFGKQWIVLRHLLHFRDQGAGQGAHFHAVYTRVLQVLDRRGERARGVQELGDAERLSVDTKMLTPPSGRLILRTILAAVPTP